MKQKQSIPASVRVACSKCGRIEIVQLDTVEDYSYTDDILYELGWTKNRVCPTCQQIDKFEKRKR